MKAIFTMVAAGMFLGAAPALAGECANGVCALPAPALAVESDLSAQTAPSERQLQSNGPSCLAYYMSSGCLLRGIA